MELFNFEKLSVWQKSRELVAAIYKLTYEFPSNEKYALCNQMQRAVVSVSSNLAEGQSRASAKERVHFIEIAYGSLMETYCQLQLAVDLGYTSTDKLDALRPQFQEIAKMMSGLRRKWMSE